MGRRGGERRRGKKGCRKGKKNNIKINNEGNEYILVLIVLGLVFLEFVKSE